MQAFDMEHGRLGKHTDMKFAESKRGLAPLQAPCAALRKRPQKTQQRLNHVFQTVVEDVVPQKAA